MNRIGRPWVFAFSPLTARLRSTQIEQQAHRWRAGGRAFGGTVLRRGSSLIVQCSGARAVACEACLGPTRRAFAIVEWRSGQGAWGALAESDEIPGGAFVHFSAMATRLCIQ